MKPLSEATPEELQEWVNDNPEEAQLYQRLAAFYELLPNSQSLMDEYEKEGKAKQEPFCPNCAETFLLEELRKRFPIRAWHDRHRERVTLDADTFDRHMFFGVFGAIAEKGQCRPKERVGR